jgi:endogenous inhibitor of DNA gyrase (YacG/DUF329 family)
MVEWEGNPHRPFCSERCQLIDFGSWVDEEFRVPLAETTWQPEDEILDSGTSNGADHDPA